MTDPQVLAHLVAFVKNNWYLPRNDTSSGYTVLGSGVSRIAFDLDNGYVAKISREGGDQTRQEVAYWNSGKGRDYIVPIEAYDADNYLWVIMPKCERLVDPDYSKTREFQVKVKEECGLIDTHSGNIGLLNGELRVLDYAF